MTGVSTSLAIIVAWVGFRKYVSLYLSVKAPNSEQIGLPGYERWGFPATTPALGSHPKPGSLYPFVNEVWVDGRDHELNCDPWLHFLEDSSTQILAGRVQCPRHVMAWVRGIRRIEIFGVVFTRFDRSNSTAVPYQSTGWATPSSSAPVKARPIPDHTLRRVTMYEVQSHLSRS